MNKMSLQKSIQNFGIKQALKYMEKDPEENIPKLMDMVDKFAPDGWYEAQRNMIRKVILPEFHFQCKFKGKCITGTAC